MAVRLRTHNLQRGKLITQLMDYHGSGGSWSDSFVYWEPHGVTQQGRTSCATDDVSMFRLAFERWPQRKVLQAGGMSSDEVAAELSAEEKIRDNYWDAYSVDRVDYREQQQLGDFCKTGKWMLVSCHMRAACERHNQCCSRVSFSDSLARTCNTVGAHCSSNSN
jgi:hypothetical protein